MKATGTCVETGRTVTIIVTRIHENGECVEYGPYSLDGNDVFSDADHSVRLTPTEAIIARLILRAKGVPISRQTIVDLGYVAANCVWVYIGYLRKKGVPIVTLRGHGYLLADSRPVEAQAA